MTEQETILNIVSHSSCKMIGCNACFYYDSNALIKDEYTPCNLSRMLGEDYQISLENQGSAAEFTEEELKILRAKLKN